MEIPPRPSDPSRTDPSCAAPLGPGAAWAMPAWLLPRLIPDVRFALAYDRLGDQRRALLKGLIADHYALSPPRAVLRRETSEVLASGLVRAVRSLPRPFALLLTDASLDAPALFLAALMPLLCSGAAEVLVARLGARSALPDALLTACELAGQERVAALSPSQAGRLLSECAQSGLPGLVLHPDAPAFRRMLERPPLRSSLAAGSLRLVALAQPRGLGLWRDAPDQFDQERLEFLFGALPFETAGAQPGSSTRKTPEEGAYAAFAAARRDLLLAPDARAGTARTAARLLVGESRAGLWTWPELSPDVFAETAQAFTSAPTPLP